MLQGAELTYPNNLGTPQGLTPVALVVVVGAEVEDKQQGATLRDQHLVPASSTVSRDTSRTRGSCSVTST